MVAVKAKPSHFQRLLIAGVMTVRPWLATLAARAALDVSALDGGAQDAVRFGGYRVTLFPITNRTEKATICEALLVAPAVAGFATVVSAIA